MPDKNTNNSVPPIGEDKNVVFEVPASGSLGLLALGAVGLKAWREKRSAQQKLKDQTPQQDG